MIDVQTRQNSVSIEIVRLRAGMQPHADMSKRSPACCLSIAMLEKAMDIIVSNGFQMRRHVTFDKVHASNTLR